MAKWKSPLLNDIRGKVGDSTVFSSWKGRNYFRSLVDPANPNTTNQQAFRESMSAINEDWDVVSGDSDANDAYRAEASPFQISGFNLFTRWYQGSEFTTASVTSGTLNAVGSTNAPVDRTYVVVNDPYTPGSPELEQAISAADFDVDIDVSSLSTGTYQVFLATDPEEDDSFTGYLPHCHVERDTGAGSATKTEIDIS